MDKSHPRGPPIAQMRKLRPGEGRARPRIHTFRYPMQGSAFCFMDWVSPFPKAQRGAETGPRSHSKSFVFLQHQAAPPCHSKCLWNDVPQERLWAREEMFPLEPLKTCSIFQGGFKELWRFQLGPELMVVPMAVHVFIRRDNLQLWQVPLSPGSALHHVVLTCHLI